jgi:hypothetical protein
MASFRCTEADDVFAAGVGEFRHLRITFDDSRARLQGYKQLSIAKEAPARSWPLCEIRPPTAGVGARCACAGRFLAY